MQNIIKFAMLIGLIGLGACDKFDVSNDNPDVALSLDNNPELLLTNIERNAIRQAVGGAWSEGNLMAQYGARIVFTSFDLFDWGDQAGTWETYYLAIRDAQVLENIAVNRENTSYEGVSVILQSWMFHILTDMWGDIPYSEAALAKSENPIYAPAYDSQEAIYTGLLEDLKRANELLSGNNLPAIKGDILYNGDLTKWRKFANSLRLRVALRLSEVQPDRAKSVIAEIFNAPDSHPVFTSNEDNAVLKFLNANPNAHPVTEESVYRVGSYNEYRIAETLVGLLESFDDPRLEFLADPTANSVTEGTPKIEGMQNGIVDGPAYEYKGGDAFLSKFNINYFYFQANTNEGRLMQYAEVAFILAEAAQRGWISSDAKAHYEKGIQANFEYWGLDLPADYFTRTGVTYDGDLETIGNQKYIALFYTDYQGFIEYRRTGFPSSIQPGPDAFYNTYPSRFEYPSKEGALNETNRQVAIGRQGPDEITTKVWWEN